jgi:1-deoxy-D-xylulose-5-phosphate reductoisomerase
VAVEAFLEGRIGFPAIAQVIEETLSKVAVMHPSSIGDILEIDAESRAVCRDLVAGWMTPKDAVPLGA